MAEYRHSGHAVCDIKYHLVWITKYRYKILRGKWRSVPAIWFGRYATRGKSWLFADRYRRTTSTCWCRHRLTWRPPSWCSTSRVDRRVGCSKNFRVCGSVTGGQHLWARGCFCATVGAVDEETIKAYIENQKWDEDDQGFKITAPTEPW